MPAAIGSNLSAGGASAQPEMRARPTCGADFPLTENSACRRARVGAMVAVMNATAPRLRAAALLAALILPACQSTPGADELLLGDANQDGVIDKGELLDYMAWRFLTAYDRDGDQKVSYAEWAAVQPQADRARFAKRDRDGDGSINLAEVRATVKDNPTFGRLMESIDTNGDGVADRRELAAFSTHADEL
jgi:Ca2+-binding EF-hand superfamily protein